MYNERIELCNGISAVFNYEKDVYICRLAWLGRDIEVWLSSGDYEDEPEIENLKLTFEKFWNEKGSLLTASQNDIREKVIPYIHRERATNKYSVFPDVSADDFDADYWLTSVFICSGFEEDLGEVQLNFYKDCDEDSGESFFVSHDLSSGNVTFYVDCDMITDNI